MIVISTGCLYRNTARLLVSQIFFNVTKSVFCVCSLINCNFKSFTLYMLCYLLSPWARRKLFCYLSKTSSLSKPENLVKMSLVTATSAIVVVPIHVVTTIKIAFTTIHIVVVTIDIAFTTILVCWGYNNKWFVEAANLHFLRKERQRREASIFLVVEGSTIHRRCLLTCLVTWMIWPQSTLSPSSILRWSPQ